MMNDSNNHFHVFLSANICVNYIKSCRKFHNLQMSLTLSMIDFVHDVTWESIIFTTIFRYDLSSLFLYLP